MAKARVLVVGCGGLGAPVVYYLAAAGVARLTLVDDDVVEASNLNRQILFRESDVGRRKAEAAADVVRALDPDVDVDARVERLVSTSAVRLAKEHDLVVDCSDGMPTKFLLNDVCVVVDKPLVHGAATAWNGQVLVVPGRNGPCLRCLFERPPPRDEIPTCRTVGILGAVTGVVGAQMAAECVKVLSSSKHALVGRFLAMDVLTASFRAMSFTRRPECAACGDRPSVDVNNAADYEGDIDCDE